MLMVLLQIWGGWTDTSPAHTIVDGVSVHTPVVATDIWRYQFSQNALTALPNIPYVLNSRHGPLHPEVLLLTLKILVPTATTGMGLQVIQEQMWALCRT
jgi:hypothetical protein